MQPPTLQSGPSKLVGEPAIVKLFELFLSINLLPIILSAAKSIQATLLTSALAKGKTNKNNADIKMNCLSFILTPPE